MIVRPGEEVDGWVAILADGEQVALAPYYSAPGRVERELPDLMAASRGAPATAARDASAGHRARRVMPGTG